MHSYIHNALQCYRKCSLCRLQHLRDRRRRQLSAEDPIPEPTRDTKTVLVIHEVVLEVVLLELAVVERKTMNKVSVN